MRPLLVLLAIPAITACATPQVSGADCTADACAGLGEIADMGYFAVIPREVVEDSRCPINARCVWAGQLRVSVDLVYRNGRERVELTQAKPFPIRGETITLSEVLPHRIAGGDPDIGGYRFGFTLGAE